MIRISPCGIWHNRWERLLIGRSVIAPDESLKDERI